MRRLKKVTVRKLYFWVASFTIQDLLNFIDKLVPFLFTPIQFLYEIYAHHVWTKRSPYKDSIFVDLSTLGSASEEIVFNFTCLLLNLINDPNTSSKAMHISIVLKPEQMSLATDLQALSKTIPHNFFGDIEFLLSSEDQILWQSRNVGGKHEPSDFEAKKPTFNLNVIDSAIIKLTPPVHYQNWARNFLKLLGPQRKIIFCSVDEPLMSFCENLRLLHEDKTFLINTANPIYPIENNKFSNIFFLNQLGLSTAEKISLAYLCDGFFGKSDLYSVMALQKNTPSVLSKNGKIEDLFAQINPMFARKTIAETKASIGEPSL